MRIFNKKYLTFIFLTLTLCLCSIFCSTLNNNVYAEEGTDLFTVKQYVSDTDLGTTILDGKVAYLTSSDKIKAEMKSTQDKQIEFINPYITYNGKSINSEVTDMYSIKYSHDGMRTLSLELTFNDSEKLAPYGKYEIRIEYIVNQNGSTSNQSLTYSFYALKNSDYYSGTYVNALYTQCNKVDRQLVMPYDRIYQFNYGTKELPNLAINYKNINITITKTFQKNVETQNIWFDGTEVQTDNNIVSLTVNTENDFAYITFNDLGKYTIAYKFIYTYNNIVEQIEKSSQNQATKYEDLLEIFGYQAFYSDIETSQLKEFKNIDSSGVIQDEITDISYMFTTFNSSLDSTKEAIIQNILTRLNANEIKVQQTNQAPVQFKYNVEIFNQDNSSVLDSQSTYYFLQLDELSGQYQIVDDKTYNYDNSPLTKAGIYLVNLVYKYTPSIIGSDDMCAPTNIGEQSTEKLRSQWFVFEITKSTTKVSVETVDETNPQALNDGSFTNKDVLVKKDEQSKSIFNAKTKLVVSIRENYTGNFVDTEITEENGQKFTKNGDYIVTMYFGKNLNRSYSSTFTIDKEEIDNVQLFSVKMQENSLTYYRDKQIEFMTNQSLIVSWNNKFSGSKITAQYKYFPITINSSYVYDSDLCQKYYNKDYSILSNYELTLNDGEYTPVDYSNAQVYTNSIPSSAVLSQSGMYIFKLTDSAGNEKYFSFIIDKTPAMILQKIEDTFTKPTELNIISNDVEVVFGQYKVMKINNLLSSNNHFEGNDSWLDIILNNKDIYDRYFKLLQINTIDNVYIKVKVNPKVLMLEQETITFIDNNVLNNFSINIPFADGKDLTFYTQDELCNNNLVNANEYMNNHSSIFRVKLSSDASQTSFVYTYKNELTNKMEQTSLYLNSFYHEDNVNSQKDQYYIPTTAKTLVNSNEILLLQFLASPEEGVLEVESIEYDFIPFSPSKKVDSSNVLNYTYSYVFDDANKVHGIVYSKTDPTKNLAQQSGDFYVWEINKEYNSLINSYQTKAGKYTITRKYATSTQLQNKLSEKKDFATRTHTFIIDRNGIITTPVTVDTTSQNMYSYVGEAIKLQVLENEDNKIFFNDVYLAMSSISKNTPILQTNKLPVFVYIPTYTYGYAYTAGGTFNLEDSIDYYDKSDKLNSLISSYALYAEIKYSYEESSLDQSTEIYKGYSDDNSGYLKFSGIDSTSGRAFTKVGYYKVTITQGFSQYGQNTFTFIFRIETGSPDFKITSTDGTELAQDSVKNYYTNNEIVKLKWEDPVNEFKAKINKNEIYYSINGKEKIKISSTQISTSDNINTININLSDIKAYANGNKVQFFMQFEGDQKDYLEGSFNKVNTLIIDTVAPEKNINKLVSLSGIDPSLVRNVTTKYNTSVSTGLYKYYAFPVDISKLLNIFDFNSYDNGETYSMYYKIFENEDKENTKYNNIYSQETSTTDIENSIVGYTLISDISSANDLLNNRNLLNKYLELVEFDIAGNITVYSIYLTNLQEMTTTPAISYIQNNRDVEQVITCANLNANITINAKSSFEISKVNVANFGWNKITIANKTYLKTPYSGEVYYDLAKYNPIDITASEITLKELSKLSASNQKQSVILELIPIYNKITLTVSVLNTSLSVFHTSTTSAYANQEGILIRIPTSTSSQDATIYATQVRIIEYTKNDDRYVGTELYYKQSDTYFASTGQNLISPSAITTTYVNYLGNTYMKIIASDPKTNIFYKYVILDNFGDLTEFTNIYGNEKIDKELSSSVDLIERYEDGVKYYYSTRDIVFKYNSAKDKIILSVSSTYDSRTYDLSDASKITEFNNSGYGKVILPAKDSKSAIYTIVMYAPKQDLANSIYGSEIKFSLKKFITVDDISGGKSYDTVNLIIYNKVPEFILLGTSNQNENELFNKGTMYGNAIKITFKQSVSKIMCEVYLLHNDNSLENITSGKIVSEPKTYTLVVKYTSLFTNEMYDEYFEFTISNNESDYYKVVYKVDGVNYYAQKTGNKYSYQDGNTIHEITNHYIINTKEYDIIYNTEQGYEEDGDPVKYVTNNIETYIHTIKSNSDTNKLERKIAITIIPKSNDILKSFSYYENEGTPVALTGTEKRFVVTNEENNTTGKRISWQSYYGIPQNLINVTITYGDNQIPYTPNLTTENDVTSLVLSTSGIYQLVFSDLAGNIHVFDTKITYTINYLKTVIYTVNDSSPINNAIYNNDVVIKVPSYTTKYYDQNAQPKLYALKNGVEYTPQRDNNEKTFTFNEPGLYKVWFTAGVTDSGKTMNINEQPLYFLIIKENESRWAFDFSEYENYYVKQILQNNVDVTQKLTNENMGNLTYKDVIVNGQKVKQAYLKNFTFSVNDALTGKGQYVVTIATDNEFNQEFTFSFWLNNQAPSIQVSIPENTETTDTIKVIFNTADLIEDVGDCVLKITGQNSIYLNSEALANKKIQNTYEIEIQKSGTHFIQLYSESGKLLYSYRVVKNEPLNAISIIVIVVSCVVVVGLTLTFILLRKKMKIR